jgi:hypothetical protein
LKNGVFTQGRGLREQHKARRRGRTRRNKGLSPNQGLSAKAKTNNQNFFVSFASFVPFLSAFLADRQTAPGWNVPGASNAIAMQANTMSRDNLAFAARHRLP